MERVRLSNTVFEGRNNAYLFPETPTTLVDTGVMVEATQTQLEAGLADHDVGFADIDRVLLTHYHADHSGLAATIREAGEAEVYVHSADAALVERDEASWGELRQLMQDCFTAWGMPDGARDALLAYLDGGESLYGSAVRTQQYAEGDRFGVATGELEVRHYPGHTAGLCGFVYGDEVLTGDALLPHYTPNVGGADVRVEQPLADYLETLERIAAAGFSRAWPGHRDPIASPTDRAREIIDHHESRAYRVLSVLDEIGPADAWTVSAELFGELENIHILHGPGEAAAHLEHLERAGDVTATPAGYQLTAGVGEQLRAMTGSQWALT